MIQNKVYLSLLDVIESIKDSALQEELMYHYEKEKRIQKNEINILEDEIDNLNEEINDLYGRLNDYEDY